MSGRAWRTSGLAFNYPLKGRFLYILRFASVVYILIHRFHCMQIAMSLPCVYNAFLGVAQRECPNSAIVMGGRLPAVAGMPANRTFLELSAGQSDWPEKNCVVLLPKERRRHVSFRHKEKRFSLWTAPCLSIKSGVYRVTYAIFRLPSLIILWPLH